MASPTVNGRNHSNNGAGTTHTVSLPASIAAGEELRIFLNFNADPGTVSASGWSFTAVDQNATNAALVCGYRTADGSEGASVSVTTTNARPSAHSSYRISGAASGTPTRGTAATGTSAAADPPSASFTSGDVLVIAACGVKSGTLVSAAPAGYSNLQADAGGTAGLGTAEKTLTGSSEDPGTFTNPNVAWVAQTYVVAASAAVTVSKLMLMGVGP